MASDYSTALVSVLPISKGYDGGHTNFVDLPTPSDYKMTSSTLVDSARNANGIVVSEVVREGVRKIEMTWLFLTQAQFSLIAQCFESPNGDFMCYLNYFDTIRGVYVDSYTEYADSAQTIRRHFYCGDRVSDTAKVKLDSNGKITGYANVKLSLIEC